MVNLLLKIFLKNRLTHEELLKKPDFQQKDPSIVWIAVPAKEKETMYAIMWMKCSSLFQGSSVPEETITRGLEQRVYDVNRFVYRQS